MRKILNYYGAAIDQVITGSFAQEQTEKYIGMVLDAILKGGGVVSTLATPGLDEIPAKLYTSGNQLYVSGNSSIVFNGAPTIIAKILEDTLIGSIADIADNVWYNVYAKLRKKKVGIMRIIAKDFVYRYDNVNKHPSEEEDEVYFSVTTATEDGVLLAKVRRDVSGSIITTPSIYKIGGYAFDISDRNKATLSITPVFNDKFLELNSTKQPLTGLTDSAGLKAHTSSSTTAILAITDDNGFRWKSNLPVSGSDPVNNGDFTTKSWVVDYVSDMIADVNMPINGRIDSVKSYRDIASLDNTHAPNIVLSANANITGVGDAFVTIKWGYQDIIGSSVVGSNTFTITSGGPTAPADNSLTNYYIYFPTLQKNFRIIGNTGAELVLKNEDGTDWVSPGFSISSPNFAVLNCNADRYEVYAIPYADTTPIKELITTKPVTYSESPVTQSAVLQLQSGTKYQYKVAAFKNNKMSDVLTINETPTVLQFTQISSVGASVTATPTANGFNVNILGWDQAERFHVVFTNNPAGASFTSATDESIISTSRTVNIPRNRSSVFYVKVRPLIGNQQVISDADILTVHGDAKGITVVGGSGGSLPTRQVLVSDYIDFDTFTGTITYNASKDAITSVVTLSNIRKTLYPTEGDYAIQSLPQSIVGNVLTIGGFGASNTTWKIGSIISNEGGSVQLYLMYAGTGTPVLPTNGTFYIGMGKKGRIVYKSNLLPIDFRITNIDIDCDILQAKFDSNKKATTPLLVRVYQEGRENDADSLIVEYTDTNVTSDADVIIRGSAGPRNIIIDFYDPSDPDNTNHKNEAGFAGRITIYGTPAASEEFTGYSTT